MEVKKIVTLDDYRRQQHAELIGYVNAVIAQCGTQAAAAEVLGVSKDAIANLLYRSRHPRDQSKAKRAVHRPKLIKYAGA